MPLHIVDFRNAKTLPEVASYLGLKPSALRRAIAAGRAPDGQPSIYIRHKIPKRRGGPGEFRVVWDMWDVQFRDAHRAFAWRFEDFAREVVPDFPHRSAFGYVRGRGIKDNAARHVGSRMLLRCDLKDFFPTISRDRLAARFIEVGLNARAAGVLADFATIEGKLALGLNASPMLANLVCSELDRKLDELSLELGCAYTRYADDIAISGDTVPSEDRVREIVEAEGFKLSAKKMRVTKRGQAHFVTGLSVTDPKAPHVPRQFKRRLRQELYYSKKFGLSGHLSRIGAGESYEDGPYEGASFQKGVNRIDGSVRYIFSIEPALGVRMRVQWNEILDAESARVSYAPIRDMTGVDATFIVDETEFERDGKKFLAVACVTTEKIDMIRALAATTLREHLVDPFSTGRKERLETKGLHFTDAPEDLRTSYVGVLKFLQFRAYVAFAELHDRGSYPSLYATLLRTLLPRRFKDYDRSRVTICVEENSAVPISEISHVVKDTYGDLEKQNNRRPIAMPACEVKSKLDEEAFSLPDCLLWIFRRTFATTQVSDLDYLRFERLRDKYRHIVNVDTGEIFSRRHPVEMRPRVKR